MEENFAPHAASETIASPEVTDVQPVEQPTVYKESNPSIGMPVGLYQFTLAFGITFGLYTFFWAYENFKRLQIPGKGKLGHVVFGIFAPMSLKEMLTAFEKRSIDAGHPMKFHAIPLAIAFFIVHVITKIPAFDTVVVDLIAGLGSFAIPFYIQCKINALNRATHPYAWGLKPYTKAQKILFAFFTVLIPILYVAYVILIAARTPGALE